MFEDVILEKQGEYWICIIGPVKRSELPNNGADSPPRMAAQDAVIKMIGKQPECWSGWGCSEKTKDKILNVWHKEMINV